MIPLQYGVPEAYWTFQHPCEMLAGRLDQGVRRRPRMPQQPELISPPIVVSPTPVVGSASGSAPLNGGASGLANPATDTSAKHPPQRIPRWLERAELFLRVLLRMYIGLAICCAPWWRMFWDQNPLFLRYPAVSSFLALGAVRGLVSGLGLLNLWIAFQDAVRHRDG